ncbi:MAG: single-stranded DNA-binding protein [Bacteroidales bacterium]|nr:single-stranded DNA-binding protein [Bacteroidales bacterium]MBQ7998508.1 single-stranded DNA-binding protein [Bacteroidales bacterium]MBQ8035169.1 single-stranded DNA-binding protein [Bacteroidales bacterium]
MSFNKVLLIGNTGRDPEVRHLESGVAVATFTLATTERYKDRNGVMQDQTEWHNIVCWRNLAELSEKYISKGTQIFVEGKIRTRSWTDQNGQKRFTTEIVADNIRLLGKKGDSSSAQSPAGYGAPQGGYGMPQGSYGAPQPMPQQNMGAASPQPAADFPMEDASDDLPF